MRERAARLGAVSLGVAIVALAAGFAHRQNAERAVIATPRAPMVLDSPVDAVVAERGRGLFADLGCARCHSVAGEGNPRSPLDGIGARRTADDIRARIVAAPTVRNEIPASAGRAKQNLSEAMSSSDLDALAAFLSTLR
jgi:mono/diheme cytochrome c family protein